MSEIGKNGTRIFKKATPNQKLTIYLGKRDFYDHSTHVDPVEGVILVDPDYVKYRKVFVSLHCMLRYGRTGAILPESSFCSELFSCVKQAYPPTLDRSTGLTRLQERLVRKLGSHAYPFNFQIPVNSAASVCLNMAPQENKNSCSIEYELKVHVADDQYDRPQKRNSVRMVIRKLTCAPETSGQQPSAEVKKEFLMSPGSLRLEASLDKENYHHMEDICVNVLVDNNTSKTVKKIKISVQQFLKATLHAPIQYKTTVAEIHSDIGFPITPCQTGWCKVYRLCPSVENSKSRLGLVVDGDLKHGLVNLASSTFQPSGSPSKALLDFSVSYAVKVRLTLGFGISDVCVQLPFTLAHRSPEEKVASGSHSSLPDMIGCPSSPTKMNVSNGSGMPVMSSTFSESEGSTARSRLPQNFPRMNLTNPDKDQSLIPGLDRQSPDNTENQSTITQDDLLFETFARFRIQTTSDSSRLPLTMS